MDFLVDLLGGGLAGGLFGILGGLGTAWIKRKAAQEEELINLKLIRIDVHTLY